MKYELIELSKDHKFYDTGVNYQIKALKNFNDVKKGDLGGYVNNENNLSQEGSCWIYDDARMHNNSRMYDNSRMFHNSKMYDNSIMFHNSIMYDDSIMYNNSRMYDNSIMYNNSRMYNISRMWNNSRMYNNSRMFHNSIMYGDSIMFHNSIMYGDSIMFHNSKMYDNSRMFHNSIMYGDFKISGDYVLENKILNYPKIYKYHSYPIFHIKDKKPTHIKMGCFTRSIQDWQNDFMNNIKEFPYDSEEAKQRLMALNYCLASIDEAPLPMNSYKRSTNEKY